MQTSAFFTFSTSASSQLVSIYTVPLLWVIIWGSTLFSWQVETSSGLQFMAMPLLHYNCLVCLLSKESTLGKFQETLVTALHLASMRRRDALEPCKSCKLHRKKCVRPLHKLDCDRCSRLEIDCILNYNTHDDRGDEMAVQDGSHEIQEWQAAVDRLQFELHQLAAVSTSLQIVPTQELSEVVWHFRITNGVMQLETPIRTMQELLLFTQTSMRYLSPFTGLFKREPLRFEKAPISISLGLTSIIQRQELLKPRKKEFAKLKYDDFDINRLTEADYHGIIDHLITLYINRYVCVMGLLHAPTFLEHYRNLENPLSSALVLAVCVDALTNLRQMLDYSAVKIRILSETFYAMCKDMLLDMYDDPDRKLDVVFVTGFLQSYLRDMTLNQLEAGRLSSVALLLCAELKNGTCTKLTQVQTVLLQRHHLYLESNNRLFLMVHEGKVDFTLPETVGEINVLDDEPERTKSYMMQCNLIFQLMGSRYVTAMMAKVSSTFLGEPFEIPLEDVLLLEPLVYEWWSGLPNEFRLCDDPFDPEAYHLVKDPLPSEKLYTFIAAHMLSTCVCASTLQPSCFIANSAEGDVDENVMRSVRERLISLALLSCKVLVYALEANWSVEVSDTPSFSLGVILYAQYCLEKIACCPDIPFPQQLLDLFKQVVDKKLRSIIRPGHEVLPSISLIMSFLKNSEVSPYDVYEQYPFAGDALIVDVIRTSVNQLEQYVDLSRR